MRRPLVLSLLLRSAFAVGPCLFVAGCADSPEGALAALQAEAPDRMADRLSETAPADPAGARTPVLAFADGESLLDQARRIAAVKGLGRAPVAASTSDEAKSAPAAPDLRVAAARPQQPLSPSATEDQALAEANARIREAAERLRAARGPRAEPGRTDDPRELFRRAVALARAQTLEEQRRAFGGLADLTPALAEPTAPSYFMEAVRMRQADASALQPLGLAR